MDGGGVSLGAGVYDAILHYDADFDMTDAFSIIADDTRFRTLRSNTVTVFADEHESVCRFYLTGSVSDVRVSIGQNTDNTIAVGDIEIYAVGSGCGIVLFMTICFFALINTYIMIYLYHGRVGLDKISQTVVVVLTALAVCSSLPLMVDYVYDVDRIGTVLAAIENLNANPQGVLHGKSAVLLIPALVEKTGISLGASYRFLLFFINIITVVSAYWCFRTVIRNRFFALLGSALYVLNYYRLKLLYQQASPEMSAALIFLPLLSVGIMSLITYKDRHIGIRTAVVCFVAGMSGVLVCMQGRNVSEWLSLAAVSAVTVVYEAAARYIDTQKKLPIDKIIMAAILVVLLAAAFKTDNIVRNQLPLWVYSPSDIVAADTHGMAGLVSDTYGIR
jgi:hypothetical protein